VTLYVFVAEESTLQVKKKSGFRAQPWEHKPSSGEENAVFELCFLFEQNVLQQNFAANSPMKLTKLIL
jgi:hypothetical protein